MKKKCRICGPIDSTGLTLFGVPEKTSMFRRWHNIIYMNTGIRLRKNDYLCENHFMKTNILKKEHMTVKNVAGKTFYEKQLPKKYLEKGTVPTTFAACSSVYNADATDLQNFKDVMAMNQDVIDDVSQKLFPSSSTLNLVEIKDHDYATPVKVESMNAIDPNIKEEIVIDNEIYQLCLAEGISSNNLEPYSYVQMENDAVSDLTIEYIISHINYILPPNGKWSYSLQQFSNKLIFEEIKFSKARNPWCKKQIIIHEDLSMKGYLMGKPFLDSPKLFSIENVKLCVDQFDSIDVCEGGPEFLVDNNIDLKYLYEDCSGRWRHYSCTLQVEGETVCSFCKDLNYGMIHKSDYELFENMKEEELT